MLVIVQQACVFVDGMIVDTSAISIGISNIISDISQVLDVGLVEAESLYHKYVKSLNLNSKMDDFFELKTCKDEEFI